jgi:hypothetical protein
VKSQCVAALLLVCLLDGTTRAELQAVEPYLQWRVVDVASATPDIVRVEARRVWRIACIADDDAALGHIESAAPGENGRVLLVDDALCRVAIVNPDGSISGFVGRCGPGPGELSGAYRALQLPDGIIGVSDGVDAPAVVTGGRGSVVCLDAEGVGRGLLPVGEMTASTPLCIVRDLRYNGDRLMSVTRRSVFEPPVLTDVLDVSLTDPKSGARELIVRSVSRAPIGEPLHSESEAYECYAYGRCDLSESGRLAVAPLRDEWAVAVREVDGTGVMLRRAWKCAKRSDADMQAVRRLLGLDERGVVMGHEPAIGRVRWRPGGDLWVEPGGMVRPEDVVACFDEFSPAHVLLRRVEIVVPQSAADSYLEVLEDGRLVLLEGFSSNVASSSGDGEAAVSLLELIDLK